MAELILIGFGGFALARGIWMLRGGGKAWYFSTNIYAGFIYAQILMGITFFWWFLATLARSQDMSLLLIYIGGGFGILGVIFSILQPSFLKPAWLKWLEREHSDIMDLLFEEAHAMGLEVWEKRVQTQVELEEWVAEVRRKYGR